MSPDDPPDERVIYRKRFQGVYFDFRGKSIFARYDRCEFVKCTLLIDHSRYAILVIRYVVRKRDVIHAGFIERRDDGAASEQRLAEVENRIRITGVYPPGLSSRPLQLRAHDRRPPRCRRLPFSRSLWR